MLNNSKHIEPIWRFPEIGVPPNHPIEVGFSMKQTIPFGYPHLWKPPCVHYEGFPLYDESPLSAD